MKLNYQKPHSKRGWRPGYCIVSLSTNRKCSNNYSHKKNSKKYRTLKGIASEVYDFNGKLFSLVNTMKRYSVNSINEANANTIKQFIREGEERFSKYGYEYDGNRFVKKSVENNFEFKQEQMTTNLSEESVSGNKMQAIYFY